MGGVLYETDFYAWVQREADKLRSGRLCELDVANLLEEIESLGRAERRELVSHLHVLLAHKLKWHYQAGQRSISRQLSMRAARRHAQRLLKENPSLGSYKLDALHDAYEDAILTAAQETGLDVNTFPPECPYTWEQAMAAAE